MIKLLKLFLLLACLAGAHGQTASAAPPTATVQTTTDDSLYIFRFVQAKDEFYVPWRNNGARLEQLAALRSNRHPPFSLRANLLRWATLTPDLGLEWHAAPRISLLLNASWTSWRWNNKDRRYALWSLSPEVRHYLGTARRGYLGLMYHTGRFNYKLGATGRQGNYHGGGITGGYLWMFRPAWGIDFHLAAGYTRAEYDTYTLASTGVLVFKERNASRNYWGINNAAITLIWKIGGNKQ